jgi:hypothetical protein
MRQKKPEGPIDNVEKSNPEAANLPEVKPGVLVGAVAAVTGGIAALRAYMHNQGAENAEAKAPEASDQTEPNREERSELKGTQDGQKGNAENVPDLDQSALRFTPFLGGKMMLGGDVQALQEQQAIKAVYALLGGVYVVQAVVSVQVSFMLRVLDAMAALNTVAMTTISDFINDHAKSYGVDVAIDSAGRVSIVGEDSV